MKPIKVTVGKKIGVGYALAIAGLTVIGTVAYRSTLHLVETAGWVEHTEDVLRNLEGVISSLRGVESGVRGYLITGEEAHLDTNNADRLKIGNHIRKLRVLTADNDKQQRRVDTLEPIISQRLDLLKEVSETRKSSTLENVGKMTQIGQGKLLMDQMQKLVMEMEGEEKDLMKIRQREAAEATARTKSIIAYGGAAVVALLALAGFYVTRNIARPLAEVTHAADKISEGDLGFEFKCGERDDEVGALMQAFQRMSRSLTVLAGRARQIAEGDLTAQIKPRSDRDVLGNAFANMVASLRRIVEELLEAANVLASSASEIVASSAQLAAGAAETASAVAETTTTLEEVKQTSQVSSQKARAVSDEAQRAAGVAKAGRSSVEKTTRGMEEIRQQMSLIAESILNLSAQGQAIGEIITSVDDLAAQSKLLAVNASIEAAKAGDEGRGFSVVAQEVKSLAEQSKLATAQVRTILSDIQKATSSAVLATEQGTKAVEAGAAQSVQAGESIGLLTDNIGQAAQAATQIAATSQQQSVGMDQVAMAMESIKTASTQTVASTRQAETAAQQLQEVGQALKKLVERFKV